MAWPKGKPRPPGSGRKKGTPNKATADIKAIAQARGDEAMELLWKLATSGKAEVVRLAALKEWLDRGFGKATQPVSGGLTIDIQTVAGVDEHEVLGVSRNGVKEA